VGPVLFDELPLESGRYNKQLYGIEKKDYSEAAEKLLSQNRLVKLPAASSADESPQQPVRAPSDDH
jgi:hypothetical protein